LLIYDLISESGLQCKPVCGANWIRDWWFVVRDAEKAVFISEAGMSAVRYHAGTKCRSENLRRTEEINAATGAVANPKK